MKRVVSWILALGILLGLTACGKGAAGSTENISSGTSAQNTNTAMGRWVEMPLEVEAGKSVACFQPPVQMADGSLCLYGAEDWSTENRTDAKLCCFTSTDNGASWTKETLDWAQQTGGSVMQVATLADGTCFFVAYTVQDDGKSLAQGWLKKAGSDTLTQIAPPKGWRLELPYALMDDHTLAIVISSEGTSEGTEGSADADGTAYVQKTILLNLDTGAVTDLADTPANGTLYDAALDASGALPALCFTYYGEGGQQMMALDTAGNVTTVQDALPTGAAGCAVDAEGNLYCSAQDGIYRMAKGGSLAEQVMPNTGFQLGVASNYCNWLAQTPNGDFIVSLVNDAQDGGFTMYRYHWDETLPAQSESSLTVWSLSDNPTIRAAIAAYQKANPDVTIEYQAAMEGDDTASTTAADAIQTLNTQLLAGEGPDVLVLDDTDYAAYARQGLLADLSGSVDTAALAQNIVSPFVGTQGTYVLPARFCVPVVTGDAGTLGSLTSLEALQEQILSCPARPDQDMNDEGYYTELSPEERYGMGFVSVKQLTTFALESSAPALVQDGKVDEDAVRQVLGFVQAVGGYYNMQQYDADPEYNGVAIGGDGADTVVQGDGGYEFDVTKQAQYGWDRLLSAAYFGEMTRDKTLGSEAIVRPGLVEGAYLPTTLMAVNANSAHAEAALAFVQAVFGEEVQASFQTDGSPVLQSALDASIAKAQAYSAESGYKGDATAFFAGLKTPVVIDATVKAAMVTHAQALVNGTETLDDAVTGVSNDLSLYLAEKQ